ncbi:MAG: hypothetical protein ACTFAK_11470 [Candidatus Electronema sp. VV]
MSLLHKTVNVCIGFIECRFGSVFRDSEYISKCLKQCLYILTFSGNKNSKVLYQLKAIYDEISPITNFNYPVRWTIN